MGMLDTNSAQKLIKPHMPVVCSKDGQFAVVDHLEGSDVIKLAKDDEGQHHYIPLSWVTEVDDKVHIDRPGDQAMQEWATSPVEIARAEAATPETEKSAPAPQVNSVDATAGKPLVARVMTRKHELEVLLAALPADDHSRGDLELALGNIESLLTGDLAHIPAVVAADMSQWLERHKQLGTTPGATGATGMPGGG